MKKQNRSGLNIKQTIARMKPCGLEYTEDGLVEGLKDWFCATKYISIGKSISSEQKEALGIKKYALNEDLIKRCIGYILVNPTKNWDSITSYFSIPDIGIKRVGLIFFCATGELCPDKIMEGYMLIDKIFTSGMCVCDPNTENVFYRYSYGNTVIKKSDIIDIYNRGNFTVSLREIMDVAKTELVKCVSDDTGEMFFVKNGVFHGEYALKNEINGNGIPHSIGEFDKDKLLSEFTYTDEQLSAIEGILTDGSKVSVITGFGGTGKTLTVSGVISCLHDNIQVAIMAPTGKASKRLRDVVKNQSRLCRGISTIHSSIFPLSEQESINPDIVIIDEASMMDSSVFTSLMGVLVYDVKFIFIGDPEQLRTSANTSSM